MMTQQLQVSILTAPVAAIDRRALSQAWYSALHLVDRASGGSTARRAKPGALPQEPSHSPRAIAPATALRALPAGKPSSIAPKVEARTLVDWDRRAPRTLLARRIERALTKRRAPVQKRTSFSIGEGAGRVHVMLQNSNGKLRLVALCLPSMRATVASALDQARFALASEGIAVESCF